MSKTSQIRRDSVDIVSYINLFTYLLTYYSKTVQNRSDRMNDIKSVVRKEKCNHSANTHSGIVVKVHFP